MSETLDKIKKVLSSLTASRDILEDLIKEHIDELEEQVDEDAEEQDEDLSNKIDDARNAGDSCDTIDAELDELYSFLGISRDP